MLVDSSSGKNRFLAIDAGTTMVKAALTDANGDIIDVVSKKLQVLMPNQDWCEMDMNAVWQEVCEVVNTLRENNIDTWDNICAIGICAQGDGMWPIDKDGEPVRNAILWNDTRAGDLLDYKSINKTCLNLGTTPLFPGANLIILRWLKEYEPESYNRIHKVLHCKDWLNYKLTDRIITDQTDASTALLNIYTKEYKFALLDVLGINECVNCFPKVTASDDFIGTVTNKAASQFKVKEGTPVIAGSIDVLAVATGCHVTKPAQKGSILGTTLCNYVVLDEEGARAEAGENGEVLCHTHPNVYIKLMAALSGTAALDWVTHEITDDEPYEQLNESIAKLPVGSEGVIFQPYLYGERAPFHNPNACSGFFGLRPYHNKYHMMRAAYEGVAMSLYDCYQNLPLGESKFILAGGASKSDLICQMVCDCMGEETIRYKEKELGILGIVSLLQKATGCGKPKDNTAERHDIFKPDIDNHESYKNIYGRFCELKTIMEPFWRQQNKE